MILFLDKIMSLNYARELLKISISQLCSAIGFDTTSQIPIDILVDVCERQFQYLAKETSNIMQLNHQYQPNFLHLLFVLLENNYENLNQLQEHMTRFQSVHFSKDIIQFPYKKRNQFYLRIPPKDSPQVLERDQNETTEYIYDWLPLFPDRNYFVLFFFSN
jgi:transcription initiation factor TFIID subunit 3